MISLGGPDQRDALAELVNIGMGQAGDSLARLFDTFISLSIPRIELVQPRDVTAAIKLLVEEASFGDACPVIAVRQAFSSRLRGEAIVIFAADGCDALADLVAYPKTSTDELLLDVSNVLVGACVGGLAAQFALELSFSPPSLLGHHATLDALLDTSDVPWANALLAEVNFRIVDDQPSGAGAGQWQRGVIDKAFRCHLLTFWPDESIAVLLRSVDAFLAAL